MKQNNIVQIDEQSGLYQGKAGKAIYLYHVCRHHNDEEAHKSAFELIQEAYSSMDNNLGVGYANGLSGIGAGISYLLQNDFIEGDEDELLASLDNVLFQFLYNSTHTDFSLNTGVIGVGHYYLNRIKAKSANENNYSTVKIKMWLLIVLDLLGTQFNLNGYTCAELKKLSEREVIDIEYFLLCFIESEICNELCFRIMANLKKLHPSLQYNHFDLLKLAGLKDNNPHAALKVVTEDKDYQNHIQQNLANLSLINPTLPAWWRLF